MLAGFVIVGGAGLLLGFNSAEWDFSTAFGGVGTGAIYWIKEVML
jgi:hypothetical protein